MTKKTVTTIVAILVILAAITIYVRRSVVHTSNCTIQWMDEPEITAGFFIQRFRLKGEPGAQCVVDVQVTLDGGRTWFVPTAIKWGERDIQLVHWNVGQITIPSTEDRMLVVGWEYPLHFTPSSDGMVQWPSSPVDPKMRLNSHTP